LNKDAERLLDEYRVKYTQAEIDALGAKGKAFKNPDGHYSYPIADKEDLANAIHAVGRGNADHDSIRRYVIRRAKALGASDMIPDSWKPDGSIKETDGDTEGDSAQDGSASAGDTSAAGVSDGSGSRADEAETEERSEDGCGCGCGCEGCSGEDRDDSDISTTTPPGAPLDEINSCRGGCSCDACRDCDGDGAPPRDDDDGSERADEDEAETEEREDAEETNPVEEIIEKFGEMLRDAMSAAQERPAATQERSEQRGKPATRSARGEAHEAPQAPEARRERRTMAFRMGVESASDKGIVLEGEPIVYNADYTVHDAFGAFTERMAETACDHVLTRTDLDCRFLFNHDGMPLARTTSGTLELTNSSRALRCRATLDNRSSLANDLSVAIERGDVDQMSIGFIAAEDRWNSDFTDRTVEALADLLDVSAVTYPASPTTSIGLAQRALFGMSREARSDVRRTYDLVCDVREGAALSQDCAGYIVNALERLYVIDEPGMPVARVREAFAIMREIRAGKKLNAANAAFIQKAISSLARADDVDIPAIVTSLQDVDEAVDEARSALAAVTGAEEKPDPDDLDPALEADRSDEADAEEREDETESDEIAAEAAAEARRIKVEAAKAKLASVKRRKR